MDNCVEKINILPIVHSYKFRSSCFKCGIKIDYVKKDMFIILGSLCSLNVGEFLIQKQSYFFTIYLSRLRFSWKWFFPLSNNSQQQFYNFLIERQKLKGNDQMQVIVSTKSCFRLLAKKIFEVYFTKYTLFKYKVNVFLIISTDHFFILTSLYPENMEAIWLPILLIS